MTYFISMKETASYRDSERSHALDMFRGFAILAMVLANYLADIAVVPAALKHAPDVGLTVIDLIAPFFIFAIGVTYGPSFRRRLETGTLGSAAGRFVRRYLAFIGIGAVISAGEAALGMGDSIVQWGVLQAIGAAGLIAMPAMALSPGWRLAAGIALLGVYQVLLDASWLPMVLGSSHGGLHGALAWAAMLIVSTAIADDSRAAARSRGGTAASVPRLALWGAGALAAGIALAGLLPELAPVSKNRVSASYVLVSVGSSAILYSAFTAAADSLKLRVPILESWGKNPLALYMLHYLLLGLVVLPGVEWWHAGAPPWLVACQAVALIGVLSLVAWGMEKKGVIVSL